MSHTHDTPPAHPTNGPDAIPDIPNDHVYEMLARRRCIAVIWSTKDVRSVRSDLTPEQCWDVLQHVDHYFDPEEGLSAGDLEMAAEELFGPQPNDTSSRA